MGQPIESSQAGDRGQEGLTGVSHNSNATLIVRLVSAMAAMPSRVGVVRRVLDCSDSTSNHLHIEYK